MEKNQSRTLILYRILSRSRQQTMLCSRFLHTKMLTDRLLHSRALKEAECSLPEDAEERSYT